MNPFVFCPTRQCEYVQCVTSDSMKEMNYPNITARIIYILLHFLNILDNLDINVIFRHLSTGFAHLIGLSVSHQTCILSKFPCHSQNTVKYWDMELPLFDYFSSPTYVLCQLSSALIHRYISLHFLILTFKKQALRRVL